MKRGQPELLKMSKLAEQSGVPAATIKHYLREGLLPEPVERTGRTMAYYGPETVERLRVIKRLQSVRFLPLKVIREVLDDVDDTSDEIKITRSVTNVLNRMQSEDSITRSKLLEAGVLEESKGTAIVSYATTAALEETLHCADRSSQFSQLQSRLPDVG